jgi:hypothetical protein
MPAMRIASEPLNSLPNQVVRAKQDLPGSLLLSLAFFLSIFPAPLLTAEHLSHPPSNNTEYHSQQYKLSKSACHPVVEKPHRSHSRRLPKASRITSFFRIPPATAVLQLLYNSPTTTSTRHRCLVFLCVFGVLLSDRYSLRRLRQQSTITYWSDTSDAGDLPLQLPSGQRASII